MRGRLKRRRWIVQLEGVDGERWLKLLFVVCTVDAGVALAKNGMERS